MKKKEDPTNRLRKLLPSQLATAILELKGKPLNLNDYKPFETIYNVAPPELTCMAGRQIGKSVSLSAIILTNSILRRHFTSLFISPLAQQTSRFSSAYLQAFFESPIVKRHFTDSGSLKNVFEKTLNTGSRIILGYAQTEQDADRIRGIASDSNMYDEIQDMSLEAIPIIHETLGASDYAFKRYTGTAKTENNTLTTIFKRSSMCEWVTKCTGCGKYNIPIDFDSCMKMSTVNPEGPGCMYCGTIIDMHTGKWLAAKPQNKDHLGFHLPQLIFPARNRPKKWKELVNKIVSGSYSINKVANEVFGVPSGVGGRIFNLQEAMRCCNPLRTQFDDKFPPSGDPRKINLTVLGVDWSVSGSTNSYTVATVLGYDYNGKMYVLYSQRMQGIDILQQVARVEQLYYQYNCSMLGSDRGVGVLQGQLFKQHIGEDKVAMVNYVSAKNQLRWDKQGLFFAADRTMSMDKVIIKAKMGMTKFETPSWELMSNFWDDALNVYEEESLSGKRLYRKEEDLCDDWLHSVVFGDIAYQVVRNEYVTLDDVPSENKGFDLSHYM